MKKRWMRGTVAGLSLLICLHATALLCVYNGLILLNKPSQTDFPVRYVNVFYGTKEDFASYGLADEG